MIRLTRDLREQDDGCRYSERVPRSCVEDWECPNADLAEMLLHSCKDIGINAPQWPKEAKRKFREIAQPMLKRLYCQCTRETEESPRYCLTSVAVQATARKACRMVPADNPPEAPEPPDPGTPQYSKKVETIDKASRFLKRLVAGDVEARGDRDEVDFCERAEDAYDDLTENCRELGFTKAMPCIQEFAADSELTAADLQAVRKRLNNDCSGLTARAMGQPPPPPRSVKAEPVGIDQVKLSWEFDRILGSSEVTTFRIRRSSGSGSRTFEQEGEEFQDSNLKPGQRYCYELQTVAENGETSDPTEPVCVRMPKGLQVRDVSLQRPTPTQVEVHVDARSLQLITAELVDANGQVLNKAAEETSPVRLRLGRQGEEPLAAGTYFVVVHLQGQGGRTEEVRRKVVVEA